jgi:hypothetical protein
MYLGNLIVLKKYFIWYQMNPVSTLTAYLFMIRFIWPSIHALVPRVASSLQFL